MHDYEHHHADDVPEEHNHIGSSENHTHNHCLVKSEIQNNYSNVESLDNNDTEISFELNSQNFAQNPTNLDDNILQIVKKKNIS